MWKIQLSKYWVDKCREGGRDRVVAYETWNNEASRRYSVRGAEKDPKVQAQGLMGEVGFALWLELDPHKELAWKTRRSWDVNCHGRLIDVKATYPWGRLLLWSWGKNDLFESKRFDAFALVKATDKGEVTIGDKCWVSKDEFFARKKIADGYFPKKIDKDTWYMDENDLHPAERLRSQQSDLFGERRWA